MSKDENGSIFECIKSRWWFNFLAWWLCVMYEKTEIEENLADTDSVLLLFVLSAVMAVTVATAASAAVVAAVAAVGVGGGGGGSGAANTDVTNLQLCCFYCIYLPSLKYWEQNCVIRKKTTTKKIRS